MLPDEDVMIIPERWLRQIHPRRGGRDVGDGAVPPDAVQQYRDFLRQAWRPEWFDRLPENDEVYYTHPPAGYDRELFEQGRLFAREWLGSTAAYGGSALGAAVVALTTCNALGWGGGPAKTAAAWVAAGGFGFAGRAITELAGIVWLPGSDTRSLLTSLSDPEQRAQVQRWYDENRSGRESDPRTASTDHDDARVLAEIAGHLRRFAATAGDDDYDELVRTLGQARLTFTQRTVASYVAPTETAWVDEDCAELAAWIARRRRERQTELDGGGPPTMADRLLIFAAGTLQHLEQLLTSQSMIFDREQVIATALDGVGPAAVTLLVRKDEIGDRLGFRDKAWDGDFTDEAVDLLRGLATDDAFRLLAEATLRPRGYQKRSRVAQLVTAPVFLRCPVLALRLLAERAEGGAPIDRDVLAIRVFRDVAVTEQALPLLPEPARVRVAALLAGEQTDAIGAGLRTYLHGYDGGATDHKRLLTVTAQLPLPGPLRLLLDQIDGKYVRQVLLAEGRRQPERMVRMLAEQAQAGHPAAGELLRGQVLTYPAAAEAAVPALGPGPGERVEEILATTRTRADTAATELLPALLGPPAGKRAKVTPLPTWVVVPALPPVRLRDGTHTLPPDAVRRLCELFAKAKPAAVPADAAQVSEAADATSLATLAWALFEQWRDAHCPGDQLALSMLAAFGDDISVTRLAGFLPEWSRSAVWLFRSGLDALAAIGSDEALTHLQRLARKAGTKASRRQAEERISRAAQARGLTEAELADRIVPDFGLDADGRMTVDYGPRQFVVSFDERFLPVITGPRGKRLKQLPRPGTDDDNTLAGPAYEAFKQLRKDVDTVVQERVKALERAMVEQRAWRAADFTALLAGHPLMAQLVRRLVWVTGEGRGLRMAEDRTLADVDDETAELAGDDLIRVAHPLLLGPDRARWVAVFEDYGIVQPFAQVHRTVFEPGQSTLAGAAGATVDGGRLHALAAREWLYGSESDLRRPCAGGLVVVLRFSPDLGWNDHGEPRLIEGVEVLRLVGDESVAAGLADLTPIEESEVLRDIHGLTGPW